MSTFDSYFQKYNVPTTLQLMQKLFIEYHDGKYMIGENVFENVEDAIVFADKNRLNFLHECKTCGTLDEGLMCKYHFGRAVRQGEEGSLDDSKVYSITYGDSQSSTTFYYYKQGEQSTYFCNKCLESENAKHKYSYKINELGSQMAIAIDHAKDKYEWVASDEELKKHGKGFSKCFIATACYGSPNAYEVEVLRNYRDTILLKSITGKALVGIYYSISPAISRILNKYPQLKIYVIQCFLDPIIRNISK